jgi:hypothetical protein
LFFSVWTDNTFSHARFITKIVINLVWENVCSHWEKQTLQSYLILKIVINLAWENVLSVHTEKKQFLEWDNFEVFVFLSVNRHFLILDLLQFLEWDNLEVFVFLSVNRQHIFSSRLPYSKNCNKFSMRKCVVCSQWEKQTL